MEAAAVAVVAADQHAVAGNTVVKRKTANVKRHTSCRFEIVTNYNSLKKNIGCSKQDLLLTYYSLKNALYSNGQRETQ